MLPEIVQQLRSKKTEKGKNLFFSKKKKKQTKPWALQASHLYVLCITSPRSLKSGASCSSKTLLKSWKAQCAPRSALLKVGIFKFFTCPSCTALAGTRRPHFSLPPMWSLNSPPARFFLCSPSGSKKCVHASARPSCELLGVHETLHCAAGENGHDLPKLKRRW